MSGEGSYEAGDVNLVEHDDYEDGDVNTVEGGSTDFDGEDDGDLDDGGANQLTAMKSVQVLEYIARSLSDDPDAVVVEIEDRKGAVLHNLHVAPGDMGRVIGRRGRTAQAIRTMVSVAGAMENQKTSVDIIDE